jgi:heavy metal sensor kinase
LERFRLILWLSAPMLLIGAGLGGYWISRRALAPVDRIAATADSISIRNLSDRLEVPNTSDELQRLSETLNRMLTRLDDSVQRMSQFTADASHELRAPVSLILTTAELAVQNRRTDSEYHSDLLQILAEAERTTRLIDSLLLLARADAGQAGLQLEPTNLWTSVSEALPQAHKLAAEKGIELVEYAPSSPIVVHGDSEALRRLSFILLDNAIKYTPEQGRVGVYLQAQGLHAELRVVDTGNGIAAADQEHIFDRFWRSDRVRSRGMGGAGLGLSIARWIVEQHQGSIQVESKPGQGSTFTVRIPLDRVAATSSNP